MGRRKSYTFGAHIGIDEDKEHEFKSVAHAVDVPTAITKHCKKYINAFLNTSGGTIYFGVEDDGAISGLRLTRSQRDAVRLAVDKTVSTFRPQVEPHLYSVTFIPVEGGGGRDSSRSPSAYRQRKASLVLGDFLEGSETDSSDEQQYSNNNAKQRQPSPARGRQKWKPIPKARRRRTLSQSSDTEELAAPNNDEEAPIYVVEVRVSKGRAPVYFMSDNTAKMRLEGSIIDMAASTIRARISDAWKDSRSTVRNIPAVPNEFIGRERDIADISEFVYTCKETCKVVCLYGRPGVGKSTLAYQIAASLRELYPNEEFVINLLGAEKERLKVVDTMAVVIKSKWPERHVGHDENAIKSVYRSCFANRRTILVIENASQADMVVPLIPRTHDCLVIVTSRSNLNIDLQLAGVLNKRLQELAPRDAVNLLREYVNMDEHIAAQLCEKCGYLPLGIRIIGGLLMNKPNLTPAMLLKRYSAGDDRAQLAGLVGVGQALEMLPDTEMDAMRILSVVPGTFDGLAAAELFSRGYEESEDIMSELIQGSLIDFDVNTRRYSQNTLLRHYIYATFAKEVPDACKAATKRFVVYYSRLLDRLSSMSDSTDRVASDRPNFEAAFQYATELGSDEDMRRHQILLAKALYMFRYCLGVDVRRNVVDFMRNRQILPAEDTLSVSTSMEDVHSVSTTESVGHDDTKNAGHGSGPPSVPIAREPLVMGSGGGGFSQPAVGSSRVSVDGNGREGHIIGLEDIGELSETNDDVRSAYEMKKGGGSGDLSSLRYNPAANRDTTDENDVMAPEMRNDNSFAVLQDAPDDMPDGSLDDSESDASLPASPPMEKPGRDARRSVPTIRLQTGDPDDQALAKSVESLGLNDYAL